MENKNFFTNNKYIIIAISFFVLDLGLTWYFLNYSDYADEGNPLFDIDGGYLALVLNLLYLITIFMLERFVVRKYETIIIESNNAIDYTKKLMNSDKYNFMITSFVFAFIISTLASRLVAIIDWIIFGIYKANFYQTKYVMLRSKMPLQRFDLVVTVIVFIVSLMLWYKLEHKKQKN